MSKRCRICGSTRQRVAYTGPIRDGVAGRETAGVIWTCSTCGVQSLRLDDSITTLNYRTGTYREHVGEKKNAADFLKRHDREQGMRYPLLEQVPLRGSVVADIGCGGGSFLDTVKGLASTTLAIEPAESYHASLRRRGHRVFPDTSAALKTWKGRVDFAVCFSVVEHVENPVGLLKQIRRLLKPSGQALLSTPNRGDILLRTGLNAYRTFYYRRAHLYYFDARSLRTAATRAGFTTFEARYLHRFKFANFMNWLQLGQPTGNATVSPLGTGFDRLWKVFLEEQGLADYLYAFLIR